MTIGVAIKSKDAVVLACDSQTTAGNYADTATKLHQLDQTHGLLMAGTALISMDIAEKVKNYITTEDNPDTRKIADITSDVMSTVYREYGTKFGAEGMQDVISLANGMPSQLLIGGNDKNEGPQIYLVNSPGIFGPTGDYQSIGSGGTYAGIILKRQFVEDSSIMRAQFLATRAVVLASEMDPYVGEGFRMATINELPHGYQELEGYIEQRFVPMVQQAEQSRRDLDTILLHEEEREKALARLADNLGILRMDSMDMDRLVSIARQLKEDQ